MLGAPGSVLRDYPAMCWRSCRVWRAWEALGEAERGQLPGGCGTRFRALRSAGTRSCSAGSRVTARSSGSGRTCSSTRRPGPSCATALRAWKSLLDVDRVRAGSRSAAGRAGPDIPGGFEQADRAVGGSPGGAADPVALGEGYVDHRIRVAEVGASSEPGRDSWWNDVPVRDDACRFLAGYLTCPAAQDAPLIMLGQPGSGKSILTRILAARLPATDFLPVRVELRQVPAEADLQDQIEFAVRHATGERISWPRLVESGDGALPVVMLDGFDELLQATGVYPDRLPAAGPGLPGTGSRPGTASGGHRYQPDRGHRPGPDTARRGGHPAGAVRRGPGHRMARGMAAGQRRSAR